MRALISGSTLVSWVPHCPIVWTTPLASEATCVCVCVLAELDIVCPSKKGDVNQMASRHRGITLAGSETESTEEGIYSSAWFTKPTVTHFGCLRLSACVFTGNYIWYSPRRTNHSDELALLTGTRSNHCAINTIYTTLLLDHAQPPTAALVLYFVVTMYICVDLCIYYI